MIMASGDVDALRRKIIGESKVFKLMKGAVPANLSEDVRDYIETVVVNMVFNLYDNPKATDEQKALYEDFLNEFLPEASTPAYDKLRIRVRTTAGRDETHEFLKKLPRDIVEYCIDFDEANTDSKLGETVLNYLDACKVFIDLEDSFPTSDAELNKFKSNTNSAIEQLALIMPDGINIWSNVDYDSIYRDDFTKLSDQINQVIKDAQTRIGMEPTNSTANVYMYNFEHRLAEDFITGNGDPSKNILTSRLSLTAKYMLIYDWVTQQTDEAINKAKLLEYACNKLGDPNLKVEAIDGYKYRHRNPSYTFCKVNIKDDTTGLDGEYIADPIADEAHPRNEDESGVLSSALDYANKRLGSVTSKLPKRKKSNKNGSDRVPDAMVLNALIPPQISYQYNVGQFFDFNGPTPRNAAEAASGTLTARNTSITFKNYAAFPSEKQYRDALDAAYTLRYNDRSQTWRKALVERKIRDSAMTAKVKGAACFQDESWEAWNRKINRFRKEDKRMPVANTALHRAVKHYGEMLKLDRVHVGLRAAITNLIERVEGFAAYVAENIIGTPAPLPTP